MNTLQKIFLQSSIAYTRDWTQIDYEVMQQIIKEWLTQKRQELIPKEEQQNVTIIDELLEEIQQ